jgi:hypothetical protein
MLLLVVGSFATWLPDGRFVLKVSALIAIAALIVTDLLLERRSPFLEIDSQGLHLRRHPLARPRTISPAEVSRWSIDINRLVLDRGPRPQVRVGLGLLHAPHRTRLRSVLEELLGPPDELFGQEIRGEAPRYLWMKAVAGSVLFFILLFGLIWKMREPLTHDRVLSVPMSRRPPAEWPEPERVVLGPAKIFERSPYVGVWQVAERQVWIDIGEDGSTYQCRVGAADTHVSPGIFFTDYRIEWEHPLWGTDTIVAADDDCLVLEGPNGNMRLEKPARFPASEVAAHETDLRRALRRICGEDEA